MHFKYVAVDQDGLRGTGVVNAETAQLARRQVQLGGFTVERISPEETSPPKAQVEDKPVGVFVTKAPPADNRIAEDKPKDTGPSGCGCLVGIIAVGVLYPFLGPFSAAGGALVGYVVTGVERAVISSLTPPQRAKDDGKFEFWDDRRKRAPSGSQDMFLYWVFAGLGILGIVSALVLALRK